MSGFDFNLQFKAGWFVNWLSLVLRPFETACQSVSDRFPERDREGGRFEQISLKPNASKVGPCPFLPKLVGCPGTETYPAKSADNTTPNNLKNYPWVASSLIA